MNNGNSTNKVRLTGIISTQPQFSHELYGEKFYEFSLSVKRLSDAEDLLPITVSERLLYQYSVITGKCVTVTGQFRSYNKLTEGKSKLILTVFAHEIEDMPENTPHSNVIELSGYVCKQPVYRTTPFSREICDILLAVNRSYGKSDYIPAIAWGRNARFVRFLTVGEQVSITGRVQSRVYQKRLGDNYMEKRTAYEVSIGKILVGDGCSALINDSRMIFPEQRASKDNITV